MKKSPYSAIVVESFQRAFVQDRKHLAVEPISYHGIKGFFTVKDVLTTIDKVFPGQEKTVLNFAPETDSLGKILGQVNGVYSVVDAEHNNQEKCIFTLAPYKNGSRSSNCSIDGIVGDPLRLPKIKELLQKFDPHRVVYVRYKDPLAFGPKAGQKIDVSIDHIDIDKTYGVFIRPREDVEPQVVVDKLNEDAASSWKVKFTDNDSDDVQTASFNSKNDADTWIKNQEIQGRYDPNGFEVVDGPYQDLSEGMLTEGKHWPEDESIIECNNEIHEKNKSMTQNNFYKVKIWVDDIRPAPKGYLWIKSVDDFIDYIVEHGLQDIAVFDFDHDAGDYAKFGGDYIKCLDYLEYIGARDINIRIHSANPVGLAKMRQIVNKNGWNEAFDIVDECYTREQQLQMLFEDVCEEDSYSEKKTSLDSSHDAYGTVADSLKEDSLRLGNVYAVDGNTHYIAEIYGGDNGSLDDQKWLRYLDSIKKFIGQMFAHGCTDVWLVGIDNDCVDDVFTMTIGFRLDDQSISNNKLQSIDEKEKSLGPEDSAAKKKIVNTLKDAAKEFTDKASNNDPEQFAKIKVVFDDLTSAVGDYDFKEKKVLKEEDCDQSIEKDE